MSDIVIPEAAPASPEPPAVATPEPAPVSAIDAVLAQWKLDFLNDSPVSRATDAYNHLIVTALPALRARLMSEAS